MAALFTPTYNTPAPIDFTAGNELIIYGTITLSGSYVAHGDALSFLGFDVIKSSYPPFMVQIFETPAAGVTASGYVLQFSPGTTQGNGVIQIFTTGTASGDALNELAAGAYPAALTGAVIMCRASFLNL